MKTVRTYSSLLKTLTSEILQSTPTDPKLNTKHQARKVPFICNFQDPESHSFRSTISHFKKNIAYFAIFPLTLLFKFQSAQFFLILVDHPKMYYNVFPYDCVIYHKAWIRLDRNCRRSSVLKFPSPYCPALTKISKCFKFFHFLFGQITKIYNFMLPHDYLIYNKVWFRSDETRGVAF